MVDISNRTISLLLIATIAIYVGGTFVTLNRLTDAGFTPTGFAGSNVTANVSVSVTSTTAVEWIVGNISWGGGTVNPACDNCTMLTNASVNGLGYAKASSLGSYDTTCCQGFSLINQSLLLRNTGNNNVSLGFNLSTDTATFFGGEVGTNNLSWRVVPVSLRLHNQSDLADTANSCGATIPWGINDSNAPGINVNRSSTADSADWVPSEVINGAINDFFICGNSTSSDKGFAFATDQNEANFDFRVVISQSQGPGSFSTIATVLGTSS